MNVIVDVCVDKGLLAFLQSRRSFQKFALQCKELFSFGELRMEWGQLTKGLCYYLSISDNFGRIEVSQFSSVFIDVRKISSDPAREVEEYT